MRSAIAVSAVPVYQEIARRIGQERMQYVDMFDYGNRDIGGGIDQFWLTGNLRIDPVEQIDFVDRLRRRALPISKRSQDLVADILPVTKVGDSVIRAKSGLLGAERGEPSLGWMVGWPRRARSSRTCSSRVTHGSYMRKSSRFPMTGSSHFSFPASTRRANTAAVMALLLEAILKRVSASIRHPPPSAKSPSVRA